MHGISKHSKPRQLKLFLAKPNKSIISPLRHAYGKRLVIKKNESNELSFTLPYEVLKNHKRSKYKPVKQVRDRFLIKAVFGSKVEWFVITDYKESSNNIDELNIQCYSLEDNLAKKKLIDFHVKSYNCLMTTEAVLKGTGWKVGYINPDFNLQYREFDITSTTRLSFLYQDMTETFNAVAVFNTVDKTVSYYKKDELSDYKGFSITEKRYLETIERNVDSKDVITRLHVTGSDGLGIQSVNPTGQRYLDDFSYYLYPFEMDENDNILKHSEHMEDDLAIALVKYNKYVSSRKDDFSKFLEAKKSEQENLTEENNTLFVLETDLKIILDSIAVAKQSGMPSSDLIKQRNSKNAEIKSQRSKIDTIENKISTIDGDIEQLAEDLKMENHFSPTLLEVLQDFIHEDEWKDDNKIDPNDLYEAGMERLTEINSPPFHIKTSIVNFFEVVKAQHDWDRFSVGDIIRIAHKGLGIVVKAELAAIDIDFESPSIDVTISNTDQLNDTQNKLKRAFYTIDKVNTDLNSRKINWNAVANNFNLRNDRVKEIPALPVIKSMSHTPNDNGSVNLVLNWDFPVYNETKDNKHNIDGFIIYLYHDTSDETYQFGSQMVNETMVYPMHTIRSYTFPSVPANLYYTAGIRAYRRVDPDINSDGILMSEIVRFNGEDGILPSEESTASPMTARTMSSPIKPVNTPVQIDPYLPMDTVNIKGRINGSAYDVLYEEPANPTINDVWISRTDYKTRIWDGSNWLVDDEAKKITEEQNKIINEFEINLRKEIDSMLVELEKAMGNVDKEMERIESEVASEVEKAIENSAIPNQDFPPEYPTNSGLWWDTSKDPPRLMRWDDENDWVALAPTEDEIAETISDMRKKAIQESRRYSKEEVIATRERLTDELNSRIGDVNQRIQDLRDMADGLVEGYSDVVKRIEQAEQYYQEVVGRVEEGIEQIEETERVLNEQAALLQSQVGDLNGKVTSVETKVDLIEGEVSTTIGNVSRIDGVVDNHTTSLSQHYDLIMGKVDNLTYIEDKNGIIESIESNAAEILLTAEGLAAKAEQITVDNLTGRVSEAEATLVLHSEGLNAKAEKSEVYTKTEVDGELGDKLDSTIYNNKMTELDLSINGITGTVTETQATVNEVTGEITNVKEDISSLSLRADGLEGNFSSINGTVNGIQQDVTALSVRANGISAELERVESALDGRIQTNTTQIDVQAGLINAKLDSTTYQTDKTGILNSIEQNRTDIQATAEGLELRVTKNEFQGLLDKKNLLPYMELGGLTWTNGDEYAGGTDRLRSPFFEVEPSATYTFSIDGLAEGISWFEYDKNKKFINLQQEQRSTFNVGSTTRYLRLVKQHTAELNQKFQIEKNALATPYVPYIVDNKEISERISQTETQLDIQAGLISGKIERSELNNYVTSQVYSNKVSELTASLDGISGKVSNIETSIDSITGDVDSALSQIGQLDVRANGIVQSVSEIRSDIDTVIANSVNLINNPASTGNTNGWSVSSAGTITSSNQEFFGNTIRVLESSSTGNSQNYSPYFDVDPSKAYEVSLWAKVERANSSTHFYLGVNAVANGGFVESINASTGALEGDSSNFYFYSTASSTALNDWHKITGYILPVGFDPMKTKGLGEATARNPRLKPGTLSVRIRFLNWSNGGTARKVWVANPTVREVPAELLGLSNSRLTATEASITTLAGQIEAKASQTIVDGLTGRMTATETRLALLPDEISLAVSEGIDAIDIGGRNLLKNSQGNSAEDWIPWANTNVTQTTYIGEEWIWAVNPTSSNGHIGVHTPPFKLKANTSYTISFLIRSRSNSGYHLNYLYLREGATTLSTIKSLPSVTMTDSKFEGNIGGDGVRVWFNFSHDEDVENARIMLAITDRAPNAGFVIREVQIEEGNTATNYSLAPEDQVNKTNVLSSINLSTEGIKIQAPMIDITGLVSFINSDGSTGTAIDGGKIVSSSITANQLNVNNIFGNSAIIAKIQSDSVLTAKLSATNITTGTLNASQVSVVNLSASNIVGGTMSGERIAAGTLDASKIRAGSVIANNITFTGKLQGVTGTFSGDIVTQRDVYAGDNVYIGNQGDTSFKSLNFNSNNGIISDGNNLQMSGGYFIFSAGSGASFNVGNSTPMYLSNGMANFSSLTASDNVRANGVGRAGGVRMGASGTNYHSIAAHSTANSMTLYPQRFSGEDVLRVMSHHQGGSYRTDFYLHNNGQIYTPPTFDSTTTASANLRVGTSAGRITRNTSLRKYKLDIESAKDPYKILDLEARTWFDKGDSERYAEALRKKAKGEEYDFSAIEYIKRIGGLVAEEVVDAGLDTYAEYDENGSLVGVAYDRIWTLLIPITRDHNDEITTLKVENQLLKNEIIQLKHRIELLEEKVA